MDIRAARTAAGLTQTELARRARVPQPNLSAYESGRRTPTDAVLARIVAALAVRPSVRLHNNRDRVRALVAAHRGAHPHVFGSVARDDDTPDSDLDLLVTFDASASLFDEVGLRLDLEELLGIPVDVTSPDALTSAVREKILGEAVPI